MKNNSNTTSFNHDDAESLTPNDIRASTGHKRLEVIKALSFIDSDTGCWDWGSQNKPRLKLNGKSMHLSRLSYIAANGVPEQGLYVANACGNERCINPAHHTTSTATSRMFKSKYKRRLTLTQAQAILDDTRTQKAIAEEYGVSVLCVGNIKRGTSWKQLNRPPVSEPEAIPQQTTGFLSWLKKPTLPTISWG